MRRRQESPPRIRRAAAPKSVAEFPLGEDAIGHGLAQRADQRPRKIHPVRRRKGGVHELQEGRIRIRLHRVAVRRRQRRRRRRLSGSRRSRRRRHPRRRRHAREKPRARADARVGQRQRGLVEQHGLALGRRQRLARLRGLRPGVALAGAAEQAAHFLARLRAQPRIGLVRGRALAHALDVDVRRRVAGRRRIGRRHRQPEWAAAGRRRAGRRRDTARLHCAARAGRAREE